MPDSDATSNNELTKESPENGDDEDVSSPPTEAEQPQKWPERPDWAQPDWKDPDWEHPEHDKPDWGQPEHDKPSWSEPNWQRPSWEQWDSNSSGDVVEELEPDPDEPADEDDAES